MTTLRKKFNPSNSNIYRGFQLLPAKDQSFKEMFDIGNDAFDTKKCKGIPLYEKTPWPNGDKTHQFVRFIDRYQDTMLKVGVFLQSLVAELFELPTDYFDKWLLPTKQDGQCSLSTLRLIHYPPRKKKDISDHCIVDGAVLSTPSHADCGLFTFLSTFHFPGLQVLYRGEWLSVEPAPNHHIVNIGKMLERMCGGLIKATNHRVLDI